MTTHKRPSLLDALVPVLTLIVLLALSVYLFGSDSSGGANQIALTIGAAVAAIVGIKNGYLWRDIEQAIIDGIRTAMGAIMILLSVGALIGTWMMAGTVPAMIFYGLDLLHPKVFYAASCLLCALASLSIGSSWTVAATIGVGLIGVALGLGLSPAITAGAVISGAYFGDKMSPLSDTTNLAPAVVGTDLFSHIRHMVWTTAPSFTIALVLFAVVGLTTGATPGEVALSGTATTLEQSFNLSLFTLLPLVVVFGLAMMKFPALPTILLGALLGGFAAVALQPDAVITLAAAPELGTPLALIKGVWIAMSSGYVSVTGVAEVDDLLTRGGMSSMLTTIWLIITALAFGAVLEHTRMLERLIEAALRIGKSTGSLVATVVASCIGMNIIAADQYIAIVLPGKMFRAEFQKRGLDPKNLSRVVEDSGTLTSALVPWNTCGAFMAAALGVPTLSYLPYAFFNLINPMVSVFYGYTGFTIKKITPEAAVEPQPVQPALSPGE